MIEPSSLWPRGRAARGHRPASTATECRWRKAWHNKALTVSCMLAQGMALICMARPLEDCTIETQSDWGYSLGVGEWKGASGHILGREIDPLMGTKP